MRRFNSIIFKQIYKLLFYNFPIRYVHFNTILQLMISKCIGFINKLGIYLAKYIFKIFDSEIVIKTFSLSYITNT